MVKIPWTSREDTDLIDGINQGVTKAVGSCNFSRDLPVHEWVLHFRRTQLKLFVFYYFELKHNKGNNAASDSDPLAVWRVNCEHYISY